MDSNRGTKYSDKPTNKAFFIGPSSARFTEEQVKKCPETDVVPMKWSQL
jgi:hypothetical protein